ncbi:MAG: hypothetical protein V8S76_00685 [Lachnospiraceae bacterium]
MKGRNRNLNVKLGYKCSQSGKNGVEQNRDETHICCNTRHHSYIRGMAQEIGLMYDDDEYRQLVKPKMLQYKYCWSDDFYTRRSNGWKDNPGNKYRKQWERGAVRKFKKEVKETQSK